ncbi:MAG: T9SS type A sorting domain-containing protein [Flavobacteriales bacterium]|nr:T9SS type A sorting domain-containing protein [Flavobacteriales bacterium]
MSLRVLGQTPGDLVSGFGNSGRVIVDYGDIDHCEDILIDSLDQVYFAGYTTSFNPVTNTDFILGKLKPNGEIDSTFGINGFYTGDFPKANTSTILDVRFADDGIILFGSGIKYGVADTQFIYVSKVNFNGELDTAFADSGTISGAFLTHYNYPGSMAVLPNGKILVCGSAYDSTTVQDVPLIGRLLPNGRPDTAFSPTGFKYWDMTGPMQNAGNLFPNMPEHGAGGFFDGILEVNGNYFLSGFYNSGTTIHCLMAMIDSTGSFVPNFATGGYLIFQNNPLLSNKIVASARFGNDILLGIHFDDLPPNDDFVVQVIDTLGTLTTNFATDFYGQRDAIKDILVHNNAFFVTGYSTLNGHIQPGFESDYFTLAKYDGAGMLNNQFAGNGLLEEHFQLNDEAGSTCAAAYGNYLVVGGYLNQVSGSNITDFGILKVFDETTTSIPEFQEEPLVIFPNPAQDMVSVHATEALEQVAFYTSVGQELKGVFSTSKSNTRTCDVSGFPPGIYTVRATTVSGKYLVSRIMVR